MILNVLQHNWYLISLKSVLERYVCIPRALLHPRVSILGFILPFHFSVIHLMECCVWGRGKAISWKGLWWEDSTKNVIQGQQLKMLRWHFTIAAFWNPIIEILTFIFVCTSQHLFLDIFKLLMTYVDVYLHAREVQVPDKWEYILPACPKISHSRMLIGTKL